MREQNNRPGMPALLMLLIMTGCDILGPSGLEVTLDATAYAIGSTAVMTIRNHSYGSVSLAYSNCNILVEVRGADGWEPNPFPSGWVCQEMGPETISGKATRMFPIRIWADGTYVEGSVYRFLTPHVKGKKGRHAYSPEFTVYIP